jgi:mRNA interferase HigB
MRIIAKKILRDFWTIHPDCEEPLKIWYHDTERASWQTSHDIKRAHRSASFLMDNRVVFNIKGNHYRLIVRVNYDYGILWIRFIGTHAEYDRIDASTI